MAKLTDLPAELVHQIISHILLDQANKQSYTISDRIINDELHHKLNHITGIKPVDSRPRAPIQRKSSSHLYSYQPDQDYEQAPSSLRQVSWPECIPSNPCIPLSLVSRTFQQCAQERLFKDVVLEDRWQAYLFHRVLTGASRSTGDPIEVQAGQRNTRKRTRRDATSIQSSIPKQQQQQQHLGRHVRTLQFMWPGYCSMGKGGGSLICEIIQSCPSLENVVISNTLLYSVKESIYHALASRKSIKEFVILQNPCSGFHSAYQWRVDDIVGRLFSDWDLLETVEFRGLSGGPASREQQAPVPQLFPIPNCSLRTIILYGPDLDEKDFNLLLKSSQGSLRTLEIIHPTERLSRAGLCWVLQEAASPDLESLRLEVKSWWHPTERFYPGHHGSETRGSDDGGFGQEGSDAEGSAAEAFGGESAGVEEPSAAEGSDGEEGSDAAESDHDPTTSPALLDIVLQSPKALRKLKCLSFTGELASPKVFTLLPQSLVKLAWEHCNILPARLAIRLSNPVESQQSLPNLLCCSVRIRYDWKEADRQTIQRVLRARGGCLHEDIDDSYGFAETESQQEREGQEYNSLDRQIARASPRFDDWRDVWDG
ncbi:uncharacterized protein PGTG_06961 [Puccinia graminis f. sp. tritici CRL 75-36-700-3]|uniref:Uncharacterized protein n=1 Tax=Puccinia graminis f. sp. tritici (strain CRL 75-36-700-3 / race SCCL) TaxID=418459 RepID=E3KAT1_PUCGT|nr:uncharacterized protein PGTG_06961 [Puccinia graminis f. sp. tritici CRL 75-36-700-3]EFP81340.1 hypothetical protein PGTG_06961 [Puccinia graminis f. sp. tritici CRL 75-36-700-3]